MADKMASKDLSSIFDPLKPSLTQKTAVVLEDIFQRLLGDLGFTASSFSISTESLLEDVSESLLGKHPTGPLESGSVSRIAYFVASDIVDNVLGRLHSTVQNLYSNFLSKNNLDAERKEMGPAGPEKSSLPDTDFWRVQIPPSSELVNGIVEEMVQMITNKLELFTSLSQIKLIQFKLSAKAKVMGALQEQHLAAILPYGIQSEADACKPDSKGVRSLETNILQCVEEIISNVFSDIRKQTSQNGLLPPRERSVLLRLVNDVFQNLSMKEYKNFCLKNFLSGIYFKMMSSPEQSRVGLKMEEGLFDHFTQPLTVTTEMLKQPPCLSMNCHGMAIFEDQEEEKIQLSGTFSSVTREQTHDKAKYESLDMQSPQSWGGSFESMLQGKEMVLGTGEKAEPKCLKKLERGIENPAQETIFSSLGNEQMVVLPAGQTPDIGQPTKDTSYVMYQALKKMEDNFQEEKLPLVVETVQKLLNENFQRIWTDQPVWPPATAPSSFAHLTINRHQQEKQTAYIEPIQFNAQTPISSSEVNTFASRLVKTIFQKFSLDILADADSSNVHLLEVAADKENNSRDSDMSSEQGTSEERSQTSIEDLSKGSQPEIHSLPPKPNLANDLVQACLAEVQDFVATKMEPRFCSRMQNLNIFTISDFSCAVDPDANKVSAMVTISQKLSSRFDKVFKALSRVFLPTPTRKQNKPVTGRPKPAKE